MKTHVVISLFCLAIVSCTFKLSQNSKVIELDYSPGVRLEFDFERHVEYSSGVLFKDSNIIETSDTVSHIRTKPLKFSVPFDSIRMYFITKDVLVSKRQKKQFEQSIQIYIRCAQDLNNWTEWVQIDKIKTSWIDGRSLVTITQNIQPKEERIKFNYFQVKFTLSQSSQSGRKLEKFKFININNEEDYVDEQFEPVDTLQFGDVIFSYSQVETIELLKNKIFSNIYDSTKLTMDSLSFVTIQPIPESLLYNPNNWNITALISLSDLKDSVSIGVFYANPVNDLIPYLHSEIGIQFSKMSGEKNKYGLLFDFGHLDLFSQESMEEIGVRYIPKD